MVFPFLFTDGEAMKKYIGKTYGESWGFVKNNFGQIYLQEEKMKEVVESFLCIAKDGFPQAWENEWDRLDKEISRKSFAISGINLEELTPQQLHKLYREIELLHEKMWTISIFIDTFDPGADQQEIEKISKKYGFTIEETQTLLSPTKPSYIADWDDHLSKYKNKEIPYGELKERFFWKRTDYMHFGELDKQFADDAAKSAHPSHFESPVTAQQIILKKYKLSKNPLTTFQTLSIWRDERKRLNFTGLYGLIRILAVSFKKQDVPLELINGLLPKEVKEIVLGGHIDRMKLTERIQNGFFAHFKLQKITGIKQGKEAEEEGRKYESLFLGDMQKDLKGAIACKGYARGVVRVIYSAHDVEAEEMQEGDILVTSMTRPEFINLMRKAAAFVTDEGGISCHAAIVAREMNKPCIIGTRIATKVLKTGDLVEVDAEKGIVKIIETVPQISNKEWEVFRSRHIPSLLPILVYWSWSVKELLGVSKGTLVNIWNDGHYTAVWEKSVAQNIGNAVIELFLTNISRLESYRRDGLGKGRDVVRLCEEFSRDITLKQTDEFLKFLGQFKESYQAFMRTNMVYWLFTGTVLENRIKQLLDAHGLDVHTKEEIFATMSVPREASYSQTEEKHFDGIVALAADKGIDNVEVVREISDFSKKYYWFPYEYVGPTVWTEETVTERVALSLGKEKDKEHAPGSEPEKLQSDCIKKYNLSQEVQDLFKILQTIGLMQDDRKMLNSEICYHLNGIILTDLGQRMKVTPEESRYIDATVLGRFLEGGNIKEILGARRKYMVVIQKKSDDFFCEGETGKRVLSVLGVHLDVAEENTTSFKGQIAYAGIVQGRARILKTSSHSENFQDGEIIVTGMTTPDFAPLLRRAGAIITDEGGITCHAAIVARELKKPCIIGTKIATQVLKDGDLVEVDADNGVVRILI
jgi:phosphohistidine swiveling domain-containing protein